LPFLTGRRRRAAAAVEFALTLPLLTTLLLGIWEVGRMVQVQSVVNNACREGGRLASTGQNTATQVQQGVLNYLARAGLTTTGASVTVTNLTSGARADPTAANQMDQLQVTVSFPYANAGWSVTSQFAGSSTTLTATTKWYSMVDLPVTVTTTIPFE
jgi:Flp pilus assembly protein TadG